LTVLGSLALRLRPLLIGVVVLVLSAGVALADKPPTAGDGRAVASQASGKTVPVVDAADEDADEEKSETDETDETVEAHESSDNCTTDPNTLNATQLAEATHGSIVCWAAHQETPEGYDNHGEFVSWWAHQNNGANHASSHANKGKNHKP